MKPSFEAALAAFALILSLFITVPAVLGADGPKSVPLEFTPQGSILVQGLVGDSIPARFILDTGAGNICLAQRLRGKLQARALGSYTEFDLQGERVERLLYEIPSLSVAGSIAINPAVTFLTALDSSKIDGVLSALFFRYHVITLDFRNRRLISEDSLSLLARLRDGILVPIKTREDRGKSLDIFFDVTAGDTRDIECRFDSGAPTTLDERFLHSLKVEDMRRWMGIDEKGGKSQAWSGKLEFIALAGAPSVGLNQAGVAFMQNMIYDGEIGWNFFTDRTVTFNLAENYAIIGKR